MESSYASPVGFRTAAQVPVIMWRDYANTSRAQVLDNATTYGLEKRTSTRRPASNLT